MVQRYFFMSCVVMSTVLFAGDQGNRRETCVASLKERGVFGVLDDQAHFLYTLKVIPEKEIKKLYLCHSPCNGLGYNIDVFIYEMQRCDKLVRRLAQSGDYKIGVCFFVDYDMGRRFLVAFAAKKILRIPSERINGKNAFQEFEEYVIYGDSIKCSLEGAFDLRDRGIKIADWAPIPNSTI